jgi:hypothetical protein
MKNPLIRVIGAFSIVAFLSTSAFSQFSLGLQGGLAKSNVEDSKTIAGGGVNLRFFPSEQFAVGIAGKIYADGTNYRVAGQDLNFTGTLMPVTATADFFFTTGMVKPYVGGDAGMYFSKYKGKFNGNTFSESSTHSNFGTAPRLGLVFDFGNVGIQVEGIYHFIFGNKDNSYNTGSPSNINFESTSEFGGINVGVIFGLGRKDN